jgi:predicted lipid carrier protein YhbT
MNAPMQLRPGTRRRPALPSPIRTLVRKLPRVPSSAVVATVLNLVVRRRLPPEVFEALGERAFLIEVRDLDLVMAFRWRGRRFVPVPFTKDASPRFFLNASDVATLAAPGDAPDDGFLRDLEVEGDAAIAAAVSRALEGLDVARARRAVRRAARLARRGRMHD